jgi:hypothetical protein
LIEQLIDGALRIEDRVAITHGPGEIGVGKSDSGKRGAAQGFARGRQATLAEEKARLGT